MSTNVGSLLNSCDTTGECAKAIMLWNADDKASLFLCRSFTWLSISTTWLAFTIC